MAGKLVGERLRVEEALVGVAEGVCGRGVGECGVSGGGIGVDRVVRGRFEDVLGQDGQGGRVENFMLASSQRMWCAIGGRTCP